MLLRSPLLPPVPFSRPFPAPASPPGPSRPPLQWRPDTLYTAPASEINEGQRQSKCTAEGKGVWPKSSTRIPHTSTSDSDSPRTHERRRHSEREGLDVIEVSDQPGTPHRRSLRVSGTSRSRLAASGRVRGRVRGHSTRCSRLSRSEFLTSRRKEEGGAKERCYEIQAREGTGVGIRTCTLFILSACRLSFDCLFFFFTYFDMVIYQIQA